MTDKTVHQDLTKINQPFGKLDDATKGALLLAHFRQEPIESDGFDGEWWENATPVWAKGITYRVRPAAPVIGYAKFSGLGPIYHSLHPHDDNAECSAEYKVHVTMPTRNGAHIPGVYTSPDGLQIVIEVTE